MKPVAKWLRNDTIYHNQSQAGSQPPVCISPASESSNWTFTMATDAYKETNIYKLKAPRGLQDNSPGGTTQIIEKIKIKGGGAEEVEKVLGDNLKHC